MMDIYTKIDDLLEDKNEEIIHMSQIGEDSYIAIAKNEVEDEIFYTVFRQYNVEGGCEESHFTNKEFQLLAKVILKG